MPSVQKAVPRRTSIYKDYYSVKRGGSYDKVKVAIVLVIVILLGQSIFQIPIFRIQHLSVQGLRYIPSENVEAFIVQELERRRFIFFKNNNYFLFADSRLADRLEKAFFVYVTSVEKKFPRELIVTVDERLSGFVVQTPDGYYVLDTRGDTIGPVDQPLPLQSVIADERVDRSAALPIEYLELATTIKELWEQALPTEIRIAIFHLSDEPDIMRITTTQGFEVRMSPTKDIGQQIGRLSIFLQETSLDAPREYIDLRFDENLYIR